MKEILKKHWFTPVLIGSIILGGVAGIIFGEKATVVQPLGDLFRNLLIMMIVPLVFFSVSSAIASMKEMKRFGKIMFYFLIVVAALGLITAIIGFIATQIYSPVDASAADSMRHLLGAVEQQPVDMTPMERFVSMVTVEDFSELLTKDHVLQLIIFSFLFGTATMLSKEKGKPMAAFLKSGSDVFMKFVEIIMYFAPIGLGAYFAATVGTLGPQIVEGYVRTFVLYLVVTAFLFVVMYSLFAYFSGGKRGVKAFWKHIPGTAVTAISTCSSAACIPVNLEATRKMGVPEDIAETIIPLGTNTNKLGSVLGGVFKIVFLFVLFDKDMTSIPAILSIIGVAFLVGVVIGAVPGGDTIGVLLIISVFGFPPEVFNLVLIISTIIDIPATLLNSTGNTIATLLVTRFVEGKNWLSNNLATK